MLILMPIAVLVVLMLAAIAVDSAVVFLAQRQAGDAAAAAANDAAGAAVSDSAFYARGDVVLDPARAVQVADDSLAARGSRLDLLGPPEVTVDGNQVCVTLHARVTYIFAPAFPGMARSTVVSGRAAATAVSGGTPVVHRRIC